MRSRRTRRNAVTLVAAGAVLVAGSVAVLNGPAEAAPAHPLAVPSSPPPNPTDSDIRAALGNQQQTAALVGRLSGQVAAQQIQLSQMQGKLQYAEQVMALRVSQQQEAEQQAADADAALARANSAVAVAHVEYVKYIQATYSDDGTDSGGAGALLTASDPNEVLDRSALAQYQGAARSRALDGMQSAALTQSNLQAKARVARANAQSAAKAAKSAVNSAAALYKSTQAQAAVLQSNLETTQAQATAAKQVYDSKVSARNAYDAWHTAYVAEQQRLARLRAAQAAAAAAAAAEARRRAQQQQNSGGSSSGGGGSSSGGGGGGYSPPAPSGGSWTAAKGQAAANRALSELGIMYAWAGGNAYGPTRGVCAGDGAWNDCNVIGFDCSGLAMYAWGIQWAHFAATQYSQAGSYHPPVSQLMPGDLLFWTDGGVWGIHHVAIYIGGGQMVEAPESGVAIRTASIWEYGSIDYTTRPLT